MKFYELEAVAQYLRRFSTLTKAERVDDNVLRLVFDRKEAIGFDLSRGRSDIFDATEIAPLRSYHAPFDTMLHKRFWGAKILDVSLPGGDKILRIDTQLQKAYKAARTTLQLEFTGRHTNAIILDEEGRILEALRHVDADTSYRAVRPGIVLAPLKPYDGPRKSGSIENVEAWLKERAEKRRHARLSQLKKRHAAALEKKIARLQKELSALPDPAKLQQEADRNNEIGTLILAHLHEIKPYDKRLETVDFAGNPVTIELPELPNPKRLGEHFFHLARRAANKAANLHIEEENLKSRIAFYRRLLENLQNAPDERSITLLFPPKQRKKRREAKHQCEIFDVDGWRVLVGRNERENEWVLKHARANDLWLHLKDRPSAHCIVQNDKRRQVPREIIEKAARICVETSETQPGAYLVDFTPRRNVKIQRGAHVNYVDYDTIKVTKG